MFDGKFYKQLQGTAMDTKELLLMPTFSWANLSIISSPMHPKDILTICLSFGYILKLTLTILVFML